MGRSILPSRRKTAPTDPPETPEEYDGLGLTEEEERHFRDLAYVELAVKQIQEEQTESRTLDAEALLAAVPDMQPIPGLDPSVLTAALAALAASHKATIEGAVQLVSSAATETGTKNGDVLALRAIEALIAMSTKPEADTNITVNVPEQPVTVSAPVTVNMPEQEATVVNVASPPVPEVKVDVAPAEVRVDVAPAEVFVHVPEQAAPVVNVTAAAEPPPPRRVRIEFDEAGNKQYVAE